MQAFVVGGKRGYEVILYVPGVGGWNVFDQIFKTKKEANVNLKLFASLWRMPASPRGRDGFQVLIEQILLRKHTKKKVEECGK